MKARVYVSLREGVLDPQGKAVGSALGSLGYECVKDVRVGRFFEIDLLDLDPSQAEHQIKEMCESLLANTIIEEYKFEIVNAAKNT